jgi:hypothetical protein
MDLVFVGPEKMWSGLSAYGRMNVWFMDVQFKVGSEMANWINNVLKSMKAEDREKLKQQMDLKILSEQTENVESQVETINVHQ